MHEWQLFIFHSNYSYPSIHHPPVYISNMSTYWVQANTVMQYYHNTYNIKNMCMRMVHARIYMTLSYCIYYDIQKSRQTAKSLLLGFYTFIILLTILLSTIRSVLSLIQTGHKRSFSAWSRYLWRFSLFITLTHVT